MLIGVALLLGGVTGTPSLVSFGRAARQSLETRFLAVPYWQRAEWAKSRYEAFGEPRTKAECYSKAQYLRLWQSCYYANPPKTVGYQVGGDDLESRRLDLLCNRLSSRNLASIREAQALWKKDPGDLMLTAELADVTGTHMHAEEGKLDVPTPIAVAYGDAAVRLAPEEPLARLARGAVCFNRFLLMQMPNQHTRLSDRIPLAQKALDDFRWFLARYGSSVPKDEHLPYAHGYVNVLEACIRDLRKGSGLP